MCDCFECERMLQPYLDRVLTDAELAEAEEHLEHCDYCRKRYRFEETLHMYVRQAVVAEPMPVALKRRLAALRTPLN
jgi:predicted anti-sigma-YlaC factor YlaD